MSGPSTRDTQGVFCIGNNYRLPVRVLQVEAGRGPGGQSRREVRDAERRRARVVQPRAHHARARRAHRAQPEGSVRRVRPFPLLRIDTQV